MANQVFNIARGKIGYYGAIQIGADANGAFQVVVLEAAVADDTLRDFDNLSTLLADAGNTEWTSAQYSRKNHADADVTFTVDDGANTAKVVLGTDDTWTAVTGNAAVKLLICYIPDSVTPSADTLVIPLTHHDFAVTPNGGDITADHDQTNGHYASA